jgi:hypothetical protein
VEGRVSRDIWSDHEDGDVGGDEPVDASPEVVALDMRSALPAVLAALAESGLIFLPLWYVLTQIDAGDEGPLVSFVPFLVFFVGGVALGTAFRRYRATAGVVGAAAAVLGFVQADRWGHGGAATVAAAAILALAVAFRMVTLAFREWQDPIQLSFGVGAGAALAAVAFGSGIGDRWADLVPVVVPVFFVASLASRAASVRLAEQTSLAVPGEALSGEHVEMDPRTRSVWWLLGGFAALFGLAVLTGGQGGLLHLIGRAIFPVVAVIFTAAVFVFANLLRPVFWLADRLHFNFILGLQRVLDRLRSARRGHAPPVANHTPGPVLRLFGLLVLVAIVVLLLQALRRQRRKLARFARGEPQDAEVERIAVLPRSRRRWFAARARREMPADTVRRWYAESLVALEERGVEKAAARTPAEFLGEVRRAFPDAGSAFEALTRAYEDVRYGRLDVGPATMSSLGGEQDGLRDVFRTSPRADEPEGEGEAPEPTA